MTNLYFKFTRKYMNGEAKKETFVKITEFGRVVIVSLSRMKITKPNTTTITPDWEGISKEEYDKVYMEVCNYQKSSTHRKM